MEVVDAALAGHHACLPPMVFSELMSNPRLAGRRAADSLIAQGCLDHDVSLVSRDADFIPVAGATHLRLL